MLNIAVLVWVLYLISLHLFQIILNWEPIKQIYWTSTLKNSYTYSILLIFLIFKPICFPPFYQHSFSKQGNLGGFALNHLYYSVYVAPCWGWVMLRVSLVLFNLKMKSSDDFALNHLMQIMPLILFFFFELQITSKALSFSERCNCNRKGTRRNVTAVALCVLPSFIKQSLVIHIHTVRWCSCIVNMQWCSEKMEN